MYLGLQPPAPVHRRVLPALEKRRVRRSEVRGVAVQKPHVPFTGPHQVSKAPPINRGIDVLLLMDSGQIEGELPGTASIRLVTLAGVPNALQVGSVETSGCELGEKEELSGASQGDHLGILGERSHVDAGDVAGESVEGVVGEEERLRPIRKSIVTEDVGRQGMHHQLETLTLRIELQ